MAGLSGSKLFGLMFGCIVVGIMLFMMFAVLGGSLSGEPQCGDFIFQERYERS